MQFMINGHIITMSEEEEEAHNENVADLQAQTLVHLASINRNTRNQLLADSDWTQANDSPLTTAQKTKWKTYRASLRDLPASEDWPNVTFPEEPS